MKVFLAKVLEAYTKFSLGQMIATAVIVVSIAGGAPMSLLAWGIVRTTHATGDTQDSVKEMRSGLEGIARDVGQVKTDVATMRADLGRVTERTAGVEARLQALEAQRSTLVSADGFRAELRRLDERLNDLRRELPGRRRGREPDDGDAREDDAR